MSPPSTLTLAPSTPVPATAILTAPSVLTVTVSPAEIDPGDSITLIWEAIGERVVIYPLNALGQLTVPIYEVPISGGLVVTPSAGLRNQASYVLYALQGSQSSEPAFAMVRIRCPDAWFFTDPPDVCPASPAHPTAMQAQHFERGLMLWTAWDDRIHILYSDGGAPHWDVQPNQWFEGMPASDPAIVPPAGLYQPVRGFGVAWRTGYVSPSQVVRGRIGWATDEEFGVPGAVYQCEYAPRYPRCFISGPEGVVYVLKPERSGWEVWRGPG
jgi:hypothetical protein